MKTVKTFQHLGRTWHVVQDATHFFAQDDRGTLTGPYSDAAQAEEWITAIVPAKGIGATT